MPVDPVKIPQNVYIEDHVVGPLSLRQIIIMALGGGFSYMIYASVNKAYGTMNIPITVLCWIPAVLAAAFAIVKINDLSLMRICFLLLEKVNKPRVRTWAPRSGLSINFHFSKAKEEKKPDAPKKDARSEINALSSMVDRGIPTGVVEQDSRIHDEPVVTSAAVVPVPTKSTPKNSANSDTQGSTLPVNPERVKADSPASLSLPPMSDLSVFRDVLPPTA